MNDKKNRTKQLFQGALAILLLLGLAHCSETPPLKLTLEQRDLVDTIYLQKVQTLGPELDSACQTGRELRLKQAVDSILAVRRSEEEVLRTKYANPR